MSFSYYTTKTEIFNLVQVENGVYLSNKTQIGTGEMQRAGLKKGENGCKLQYLQHC